MSDKELINEFVRCYSDCNSIGEVMDKLSEIMSPQQRERLIKGLERLRR